MVQVADSKPIHSHPHYTRETKVKPMAADQESKSHETMAEAKDTVLRRDSTFYLGETVVFQVGLLRS